MSVKIDKGRLAAGLELTPMIDIVFLLMIFFLVASKLDEDDRSLDVVLPQAAAAKPLTSQPREFVINIDRAGTVYAGVQPGQPGGAQAAAGAVDGRQSRAADGDSQGR